jgi:Tol biopolymer transport system component
MKKVAVVLIVIFFTMLPLAQENAKDKSDFPVLTGPYLGQKPPGTMSKLFAPGIISKKNSNEFGGHFSPDGSEFFFTRYSPGEQGELWMTELDNDNWTLPRVVSFLKDCHGVESCMSFDGNQLFFVWYDPESGNFQHDIYVIERIGKKWGVPHQLTKTNLGSRRISPSVARNGNLYFSGDFNKAGQKDIYCSRLINGKYSTPQNLGSSVNSTYHEEHVFISPGEHYLLFDSYRPSEYGEPDIYVSYRMKDGTWSEAQNLGPSVNSEYGDWYPKTTPDGKYIIFSRTFPSIKIDLYWVDAKIIKDLKPEELK